MVHELGICVFVCIFAASLGAFEGIFMCIWGVFSWAFYGCFVCILVNFVTWWVSKYYITSVDIFAARMAEYISAFRYILTKWCNKCVNGPSRSYKAKKIIVVYVIWNVVKEHCNIFWIYVLLVHRPFPIVSFLTNGHFLTRLPGDQQRTRQNVKSVYCNGGFCLVMAMGD